MRRRYPGYQEGGMPSEMPTDIRRLIKRMLEARADRAEDVIPDMAYGGILGLQGGGVIGFQTGGSPYQQQMRQSFVSPEVAKPYADLTGRIEQIGKRGYTPYTGQRLAATTGDQSLARAAYGAYGRGAGPAGTQQAAATMGQAGQMLGGAYQGMAGLQPQYAQMAGQFGTQAQNALGQAQADAGRLRGAGEASQARGDLAAAGMRQTGAAAQREQQALGAGQAAAGAAGEAMVKRGYEAFDQAQNASTSLASIDEAIAALDSGAESGLVYKFIPDVTEASASLNVAMNKMGLDVISSVTFGALSVAEMNLAMQTAVPRDLSPPELRSWLVSKRDAQAKTRDALMKAASYLTTPGNTLQGWLDQQSEAESVAPPVATRTDADLLKQYGVLVE